MTRPIPRSTEQPPAVLEEWLTRAELAAELGVTVDTLCRWECRRSGPMCVRVGRRVMYRRSNVEKWLRKLESKKSWSRR